MWLTVFYTVSLRGRLDVLPRLFSSIRLARASLDEPSLLLDLGESCTPDVWLCEATAGRALLVAMDSMGYDGFHLGRVDSLYGDVVTLGKLRDTILTPIITDGQPLTLTRHTGDRQPLTLSITGATGHAPSADLVIRLEVGASDARMGVVNAAQPTVWITDQGSDASPMIGRVGIERDNDSSGSFRITEHRLEPISESIMPDPTISSVIEFVESEARYATRKQ